MDITLPPFSVEHDIHPELRKFLDDTRADVSEIKTALVGNNLGTTGLIPRVSTLEHKQKETDKKIFKASVILSAIGTVFVLSKDIIFEYFKSSHK